MTDSARQYRGAQAPSRFLTKADIESFEEEMVKHREWVTQYLGESWVDTYQIGEECERWTSRGWVPARVVDISIEDRVVYIVECLDPLGRLRERRVTSGELRKRSNLIGG